MECMACGGEMKGTLEPYVYDKGGLNVGLIRGVETFRCALCGETSVAIPRIRQLQRVIVAQIAKKPWRLTPMEIRFLRKHLGWSGKDFAGRMGVTPSQVSRWERAHEVIGPLADRLLRLMAVREAPIEDYSLDELAGIADEPRPASLRFGLEGKHWRPSPTISSEL